MYLEAASPLRQWRSNKHRSHVRQKKTETDDQGLLLKPSTSTDPESQSAPPAESDVFGNEEGADVQYKTCEW
jgi:hypothetical protein